ncbi:MAG: AAA family ATPase, partial [Deltaproteobacteria bacterium]|nr:AAA family ATPase [Deltaproteobacteria bacterium]MBW2535903.1 AAA family ATPase [Deltaproteobacteria bacterium]
LERAQQTSAKLIEAIGQVIVGQAEVVEQTLWGLCAGGHVLLEGAPGLGKTLLVRTLAHCMDLEFSRIQFTPDLMPSDVTGTNILVTDEQGQRSFALHRGPIFGQVILADEINRATPKTQSALLEAMQEHACTIAGKRHAMVEPFFVLATENPIEMEGTYPLPEAQLDRFLLKVLVPHPPEDEVTEILVRTTGHDKPPPDRVLSRDDVMELRSLCRDVAVAEPLLRYAARLIGASDPAGEGAPDLVKHGVRYGDGVRGAQSLILAAKAAALLQGRPHVSFADVQRVSAPVLRHRIIRSFEGEADGISTDDVVAALVEAVPARPTDVERASA